MDELKKLPPKPPPRDLKKGRVKVGFDPAQEVIEIDEAGNEVCRQYTPIELEGLGGTQDVVTKGCKPPEPSPTDPLLSLWEQKWPYA